MTNRADSGLGSAGVMTNFLLDECCLSFCDAEYGHKQNAQLAPKMISKQYHHHLSTRLRTATGFKEIAQQSCAFMGIRGIKCLMLRQKTDALQRKVVGNHWRTSRGTLLAGGKENLSD